jgi:creatinine amidohydrolase
MSWPEVEKWVVQRRGSTSSTLPQAAVAVLPVGATEQHGPMGLIGTDHQTAEAVARGACATTGKRNIYTAAECAFMLIVSSTAL